eukprot:10667353-Karenia_brevis.AAC.1
MHEMLTMVLYRTSLDSVSELLQCHWFVDSAKKPCALQEMFFDPFRIRQTACVNQSKSTIAHTVLYWPPDISDNPADYHRHPGVTRPPGCA